MGLAQLLGGIVVLVAGLAITFAASQLPYMSEFGPGPGLLPLWIGIVLSACAVGLIVKAAKGYGEQTGAFFQARTKQVVFIFATLVATILLIRVLGLSIALALFSGFTARMTGPHGMVLCVSMAVVTAVAVKLIFGHMLDIPIPKGIVGF